MEFLNDIDIRTGHGDKKGYGLGNGTACGCHLFDVNYCFAYGDCLGYGLEQGRGYASGPHEYYKSTLTEEQYYGYGEISEDGMFSGGYAWQKRGYGVGNTVGYDIYSKY